MVLFLLPLVAVSILVGVLSGAAVDLGPGPLVAAAFGLLVLTVVLRRSPLATLVGLALAALATGAALAACGVRRERDPCHVAHRRWGRDPVRLHGEVAEAPALTGTGARVRLRALEELSTPARLCGAVELHLPSRLDLSPGERVVARARLREVWDPRNPGAMSAALRHASDDVGAVGRATAEAVLVVEPRSPSLLLRARQRIRAALEQSPGSAAARGILIALVLGDRDALAPSVQQAFARAGLSHILAVSGMHLTILAGGLLLILRWLLLRVSPLARRTDVRRVAAPLAAAAAVLYTLLTGCAPSAVRACVMSCACFAGSVLGRPPQLWRPLALAVVVLLAIDPLNLFRPSFQLSFAAVVGLGLLATGERTGPRRPPLLEGAWGLVRTTAAATLLTAPVAAHHFHLVSLVGLLANLVGIPLSTFLLMPVALLGALLSLVHADVGGPLLLVAGYLARALDGLAALAAAPDRAALTWAPGWPATIGLTAAGAALLLRRRARALLALLAGVLVVGALLASLVRARSPGLELTLLDVGQGDAIHLGTRDEQVLVDGGASRFVAETQVIPFLRARGVRRLDLVVVTHPHPDHLAGLSAILEQVPVAELWACWHGESEAGLDDLLALARQRGARVSRPYLRARGRLTIRPLWPAGCARAAGPGPVGACADPAYEANDNSIVLRLEVGRAAALLAADIENDAEAELVRGSRDLIEAQVLKVPHHGSASSSSEAFIAAVSPRVALVSSGRGNAFGLPAPRVLERYRRRGILVLRTEERGAIRLRLEPEGGVSEE